MARPAYFNYLNPLTMAAMFQDPEKPVKDEEDLNGFDPETETFTLGGVTSPTAPNPAMLPFYTMPQYAGRAPMKPGELNKQLESSVAPETRAAITAHSANVTNQTSALADMVEHSQDINPALVGVRDKLRGRIEDSMSHKTTATYNPTEKGFKGGLRHVGESILASLANTPRDAAGRVDPLVAGVAATTSALFGGGGIHQQIAQQFLQPVLDEKLKRERDDLTFNESGFNNLSKMYPNNAEQRVRAAEIRLGNENRLLGTAEADERSQKSVGLKQYEMDAAQNARDAATASRFEQMREAAIIRAALAKDATGRDLTKGRLTYTQQVEQEVNSVAKDYGEANLKYNEMSSRVNALQAQLNGGDLKPSEEADVRKQLTEAQAQQYAYQSRLQNDLPAAVSRINSRFGKPVVTVENGVVTKTKEFGDAVGSTYDAAVAPSAPAKGGTPCEKFAPSLAAEMRRRGYCK